VPDDPNSETLRRRVRGAARAAAGLVGAVLEAHIGWQYVTAEQGASGVWLLSAAIGAASLAYGLSWFTRDNGQLMFWLYAGVCLFVPFYGAIGSAVVAWYLRRTVGGDLAEHFAEYIHVDQSTDEADAALQGSSSVDQMVHHELSVQSFMDIMRGPDRVLKKSLIGKILSEWTPNAVALLHQGLRDSEYEIRSYSSTALTAIENRMGERIQRLRKEYDGSPESASVGVKLAQSYLDYTGAGLLDEGSSRHYVQIARGILAAIPDPDVGDPDLWMSVATLRAQAARLSADMETEAAQYDLILAQNPEHQETLTRRCSLLFRQRRFSDLRQATARFLQIATEDHPATAAARLWSPLAPELESR
jgi:hypothetical protein